MGKGQRSREARAGKREELKKIAAKKKLQQKIRKITGITIGCIVAVGIVAMVAYNTIASTGFFLRNTVAMKSDNFKIDNAMMTYYVKNQYYSLANQFSDLSSIGLDSEKSLASQDCAIQEGTWLDYFLDQAKEQAKDTLALAEKAKAEGIELTEEDKKEIDDTIASFKSGAESNNVTLKQYYALVFGKGIKENDVRRAIELSTLASNYYNKYEDSIEYTDEDYQTYFNENQSTFVKADYLTVSVPGETEAEIRTNAKIFQDCKTPEEFTKNLENLFRSNQTADYLEANDIASDADLTEDQRNEIQELVTEEIEAANATAYKPADDAESVAEFNKWLFEDGRKANEIYTVETAADEESETSFSITVYMVTKPAYCDDYNLLKARHILFTADKYETDEAAKAKAEEVLGLYNAEPTAEKFAALVKEYSEDTSTLENGGLYEQITDDTDSWPFADWVYDEARKVGDVEVVSTSAGYHIMYFEGEGDVAWKATAKANMLNDEYTKHIEELENTYTIEQFDNKMKAINV